MSRFDSVFLRRK